MQSGRSSVLPRIRDPLSFTPKSYAFLCKVFFIVSIVLIVQNEAEVIEFREDSVSVILNKKPLHCCKGFSHVRIIFYSFTIWVDSVQLCIEVLMM